MLTNSKSVNSSLYPDFIKNNELLKSIDNRKIFPEIGLKNCKHSFSVWNQEGMYEASISYLKYFIFLADRYRSSFSTGYYSFSVDGFLNAVNFLERISTLVKKNPDSFISKEKIGLVIPENIGVWPKGSDFFIVLSSYLTVEVLNLLPALRNICKEYYNSFLSLDKYNLNIVFSGTGDKCQWDISTMSMRGIDSCQKWTNPHARALIGSMADPCAGIIYIEDSNESSTYGTKMIKRSVVRLVLNKRTNKPAILLERIYPHDYDSGIPDYITMIAFDNFLDKKTKGKYPIVYGEIKAQADEYFIPKSEILKYLLDSSLSYRDSKISYEDVSKNTLKNKAVSKLLFNKV